MLSSDTKKGKFLEHWSLVLVELVHLLGLFFSHSRHSKGARATGLLYEQFIRYFEVLSRMPEHNGILAIRKIDTTQGTGASWPPEYAIISGKVAILEGQVSLTSENRAKQLSEALQQAFGCLAEQGIQSLLIRWPGRFLEKIEQLRLALNIIARYTYAAENESSITFRYFGHALVLPLIKNAGNRPDPNLTLTAALNSLSETNARELIKQAQAYYQLRKDEYKDLDPTDLYKLIFSFRSLRSQLICPLVEMNTLTSEDVERMKTTLNIKPGPLIDEEKQAEKTTFIENDKQEIVVEDTAGLFAAIPDRNLDFSLERFLKNVEKMDDDIRSRITLLFADDWGKADPQTIGDRLAQFSELLKVLETKNDTADVTDKALRIMRDMLESVDRTILQSLTVQRRGLKIISSQRTIVIGMVHPKLVDLLMLTKEKISTEQKITTIAKLVNGHGKSEYESLGNLLGVNSNDIDGLISFFRSCLPEKRFDLKCYQRGIEFAGKHADALFALFWCYLRQWTNPTERIQFLHTMQGLIGKLGDVKHAIGFLMTDIYQNTFDIQYSDRNAYYLLNHIIGNRVSGLNWDSAQTPSALLTVEKELDQVARSYAAWRLDFDQIRSLTKLRTLYDRIREELNKKNGGKTERGRISPLLSLIRESFIFYALAGGETSRIILLDAIGQFGNPLSDIYKTQNSRTCLPFFLTLLQLSVQGIGKIGVLKDIDSLKEFETNAGRLKSLDSDPGHVQRLNKVVKWVAPAIKSIHLRAH